MTPLPVYSVEHCYQVELYTLGLNTPPAMDWNSTGTSMLNRCFQIYQCFECLGLLTISCIGPEIMGKLIIIYHPDRNYSEKAIFYNIIMCYVLALDSE